METLISSHDLAVALNEELQHDVCMYIYVMCMCVCIHMLCVWEYIHVYACIRMYLENLIRSHYLSVALNKGLQHDMCVCVCAACENIFMHTDSDSDSD